MAQWRVCRFRSSRVDPVRVADPAVTGGAGSISRLRPHEIRTSTDELTTALTTTLRYFPQDGDVIRDCLAALGLPPGSVSIGLGGNAIDATS